MILSHARDVWIDRYLLDILNNINSYFYLQMILFWKSTNKENEIDCERLVKYDGKKIEVAGLEFGNFKLGRFGFEPTLLQDDRSRTNAVRRLSISFVQINKRNW